MDLQNNTALQDQELQKMKQRVLNGELIGKE